MPTANLAPVQKTDELPGVQTIPSPSNAQIERLEAELLKVEQVECPLNHRFAPGVYMREIFMPKGTFIIGHEHKTEHLNVVLCGRASVLIDGVAQEIVAPCTFKSGIGVRKLLFIHEDMIWATIHPTHETNVEQLEAALIIKSDTYLSHQAQLQFEQLRLKQEES